MTRNKVAPQKSDSFFKKGGGKTQKREGLFKRNTAKLPGKKMFNRERKFEVNEGDFSHKKPHKHDLLSKRDISGASLKKHPRPNQGRVGGDSFFVKPSNSDSKPDQIESDLKPAKSGGSDKRPFDKKLWRLQKYSKKYKLEQWEDKRKKAVLRGYYKEIKDEDKIQKLDVAKIYEEQDEEAEAENDNNVNSNIKAEKDEEKPAEDDSQKKTSKPFKRARLEFERLKEEKKRHKEEALKAKAEKAEAIKEYKLKKQEKFKRLNKKTKKGQPIMKDRMEMLLEKIQQTVGPSSS